MIGERRPRSRWGGGWSAPGPGIGGADPARPIIVIEESAMAVGNRAAAGTTAPIVDIRSGALQVRLAESEADIEAAQALRYRVFYEALGARAAREMRHVRRDVDRFDESCDHLLVLDHSRGAGPGAVVGTYRLIRRAAAARVLFGGRIRYLAACRLSRRDPRTGPLLCGRRLSSAIGRAIAVERHRRLCVSLQNRSDVRVRKPARDRSGAAGAAALLSRALPSRAAGVARPRARRPLYRDAPAAALGNRQHPGPGRAAAADQRLPAARRVCR